MLLAAIRQRGLRWCTARASVGVWPHAASPLLLLVVLQVLLGAGLVPVQEGAIPWTLSRGSLRISALEALG